jgi:hypothetical protein
MADALAAVRYELALANRIIAHEGVLDGFGPTSACAIRTIRAATCWRAHAARN